MGQWGQSTGSRFINHSELLGWGQHMQHWELGTGNREMKGEMLSARVLQDHLGSETEEESASKAGLVFLPGSEATAGSHPSRLFFPGILEASRWCGGCGIGREGQQLQRLADHLNGQVS